MNKKVIVYSVVALLLFFSLGIFISFKISESVNKSNEHYNNALFLESEKEFEEFMHDKKGNAFVYGPLDAIDGVTFPVLDSDYIYVSKKYYKKVLTTSTYTDSEGHVKTKSEYKWKLKDTEELKVSEVSFFGQTFSYEEFDFPMSKQIYEEKIDSKNKYKYNAILNHYDGTVYLEFNNDGQIKELDFMDNMTIKEAFDLKQSDAVFLIFIYWIFYLGILGAIIYVIKENI